MKKETHNDQKTTPTTDPIKEGDAVTLHYTGTLTDGSVFDSSDGRSPLTFEVGSGDVILGFEKAVEGMKPAEQKKFTVPCNEAYGPIRAELLKDFPKKQLPPEMEAKVGMQLAMQGPQGQAIPVTIAKVNTDTITIDLNHPLAGKDLTFDIKIVAINDPQYAHEHGGCCGEGESKEGGCGSGSCGEGGCGSSGCGDGGCCK